MSNESCNHTLPLLCLSVSLVVIVAALSEGYCFRFTYLGPGFDSYTGNNNSSLCKEVLTSPCVMPLLTTAPKFTEIWELDDKKYLCPLDQGSVCAKWTNYFNNEIVNVSYLCTRISVAGDGALETGCITQYEDSYSVEVCACRTLSKHVIPCNYAAHHTSTLVLVVLLLTATAS